MTRATAPRRLRRYLAAQRQALWSHRVDDAITEAQVSLREAADHARGHDERLAAMLMEADAFVNTLFEIRRATATLAKLRGAS